MTIIGENLFMGSNPNVAFAILYKITDYPVRSFWFGFGRYTLVYRFDFILSAGVVTSNEYN